MRLLQLRHPDLLDHFPVLRRSAVVAHNLPFLEPSSSGARKISPVASLLRSAGVVSVVGLGGVGKTRLAIQIAFDVMDDFPDGAWLVELAPVADPASVPRAIAAALGVAEQPAEPRRGTRRGAGPKAALLVLDNCEHLLDAVASTAENLLRQCPHVGILATSREPLDIEGEAVWRVEPLRTLDPGSRHRWPTSSRPMRCVSFWSEPHWFARILTHR